MTDYISREAVLSPALRVIERGVSAPDGTHLDQQKKPKPRLMEDRTMYDELVRLLKVKAQRFDYDGWVDTAVVMAQAAEAIEVLSRENKGEAPRWIPVTERLPEEDVDVLVFTNEGEMFKAQYMGIMGGETIFDDYNGSGWEGKITHWRPLPEPPKEEA